MTGAPTAVPIVVHSPLARLDPFVVASGPPIAPIERVTLFSAQQWEQFVDEWATSLSEYTKVERASGAGDKGCDVIAFPAEGSDVWDNFQCKHYEKPLTPSDAWVELGKVCYYTFLGEYSIPRKYRFVAPRNVGTKLASLLRRPETLKAKLIEVWPEQCQNHIKCDPVPLTTELRAHICKMDFSIFGYQPVLEVIQQHMRTQFYVARFGLGLPERPQAERPPEKPASTETRYVQQLFEAYGDNKSRVFSKVDELPKSFRNHYNRSREAFYSAEALRNFSRDKLPGDEFEQLQNEVFTGVVDICEAPHPCGFTRLTATTSQAAQLSITSSPLIGKTSVSDLHGICHQLANEDRLTWVEEKEAARNGK